DPVGRTMFPPINRFGISSGAYNSYQAANQFQAPSTFNPQMNSANQRLNQGYDPNVPLQPNPADVNGWRFANQNGNWWYWMPENYWVSWNGSQWNRYNAGGATTNAAGTMFGNSAPAVSRPMFNNSTTTRPQDPAASIPNFQ